MTQTVKVAFTISRPVLAAAKKRAKASCAKSLSAFVNEALAEKVQADDLAQLLDQMDQEHGAPTAADRKWAKRVLGQ